MIFSIGLYSTKCNTFILKCFILFTCTNLDGGQKEGGNFLNLLQKDGVSRKGEGGIPSEKEGGWRKLGGNCEVKAAVIELQAKTKENEVSIEEILSFLQTKKSLKSETGNLFK